MRRTKIVCTIGPASQSPEVLTAMIEAGMDVARLNFSHGTWEQHAANIRAIREIAARVGRQVAILQDLCGPKVRVGEIGPAEVTLVPGQTFTLTTREIVGNAKEASVPVPDLPACVGPGNRLFLNDGIIELEVVKATNTDIETVVRSGGPLSTHKGLNLPDVSLPVAAVTPKDLEDLEFGISQGVDWVAASFVRTAKDLEPLRQRMAERGAKIPIIAKIEKHEAVRHLAEILQAADGAMVARGDLGIEVHIDEVPLIQKSIIAQCNALAKPVITATEMLDSMYSRPRPTRAEVTDVANAIFDGTDCVMTSRETATGAFPVETVRMMHRIAASTEQSGRYQHALRSRREVRAQDVTEAVGEAVRSMANDLRAAAVIPATTSGYTARMVARFRPACPIIAASHVPETVRRLALTWGVLPVLCDPVHTTDETLREAVSAALRTGLVKAGDLVVISAGVPIGTPGQTNLIKVERVGDSGEPPI